MQKNWVQILLIFLYAIIILAYPVYHVYTQDGFSWDVLLQFFIDVFGCWFFITSIGLIICSFFFLKGDDRRDIRWGCMYPMLCVAVYILMFYVFGRYEPQSDKETKSIKSGLLDKNEETEGVWICTGKSSHAYHSTSECYGIQSCRSKKKKISLEDAKAMGRTPCHYCHKGTESKSTLSKDALYYVCTDDDNDGYYHSTPACEILDECNNDIEEVTYADVELSDRDPCPDCINRK